MDWIKVTIKTATSGTEIVTALLIDMGINGVEIKDPFEMAAYFTSASPQWDYVDESLSAAIADSPSHEASIIFYLGTDLESEHLLARITDMLNRQQESIGYISIATESVNDENWLHEWKKHFHPIKIGRVLIVPEWETATNQDEIVFTIDPGSAFGTGQHATTMLCVEALQGYLKPGHNVLDIGCGSGILSIISLLLGANKTVACDIDPSAIEVTKKNASLNPINPASLETFVGNILACPRLQASILSQSYDIIVANIVADVIIELVPFIRNILAQGKIFIASGIISERLADVISALSCFAVLETKEHEGWCCVVAVNNG